MNKVKNFIGDEQLIILKIKVVKLLFLMEQIQKILVKVKWQIFYFLAALAEHAEDSPDKAHLKLGERIIVNFLVHKVNEAGFYAMRMTVDEEE